MAKGILTALPSGVDCEHIYGAIFSMRTLDAILYGLLIVSCLFSSANKGTSSKGMIEFRYRFITNVGDLLTSRSFFFCLLYP